VWNWGATKEWAGKRNGVLVPFQRQFPRLKYANSMHLPKRPRHHYRHFQNPNWDLWSSIQCSSLDSSLTLVLPIDHFRHPTCPFAHRLGSHMDCLGWWPRAHPTLDLEAERPFELERQHLRLLAYPRSTERRESDSRAWLAVHEDPEFDHRFSFRM
jgi:hypothetical protein